MTRKLTLGTIVTVVLAIGVIGSLNYGIGTSDEKTFSMESLSNDNTIVNMAFAEKPHRGIIPISVDPEFGMGSAFDVNDVKCKISHGKKHGVVTAEVKWCKAKATLDRIEIPELLESGLDPENFQDLLDAIQSSPGNFDEFVVAFEFELLTTQIQNHLDTLNPPITLPEDFKKKSIKIDMSTKNKKGVETTQTKLLMMIEY